MTCVTLKETREVGLMCEKEVAKAYVESDSVKSPNHFRQEGTK